MLSSLACSALWTFYRWVRAADLHLCHHAYPLELIRCHLLSVDRGVAIQVELRAHDSTVRLVSVVDQPEQMEDFVRGGVRHDFVTRNERGGGVCGRPRLVVADRLRVDRHSRLP